MTITTLAIATLSSFMVADAQEKAEAPEATTSLVYNWNARGRWRTIFLSSRLGLSARCNPACRKCPAFYPATTEEERMVSEQAARRIKADYATYLSTAPLEQMMKSLVDLCSERMKELQQIPNSTSNAK